MDAVHADRLGAFDVGRHVVDEHGVPRLEAAGTAGQLIDRGIGFGMADQTGDDIIREQPEEGMAVPGRPALISSKRS